MDFAEFRTYVMSQPADRTINHNHGWCSCAVGDAYFALNPDEIPDIPLEVAILPEEAEDCLEVINGGPYEDLYDTLNKDGIPHSGTWRGEEILRTYGDLQDYITHLGI